MEVFLIIFLILLNGVFAMSEMAVSVSRKARLTALAASGDHGAQNALKLMDNPTNFLSTVQIGITSIGVLNGIFGEAAFSDGFSLWLQGMGMGGKAAGITATILVVTVITFASIVFGELVPKRIGLLFPETVARWVAGPMRTLAKITKPFVWLLSASTQAVIRLLSLDKQATQTVTEEEISAQLNEGVDAGVIEAHENLMVHNVFYLDDRQLGSLMVPRGHVEWLESVLSIEEALTAAGRSGHSYYPVCKDGLNDVLGVIAVADMLGHPDKRAKILSLIQPAVFVPETLSGMEMLEQFRTKSMRVVFVVDEYGVVQGMLTPFDLMEAITGELRSATQENAWATQEDVHTWLLDGAMPVNEVKARLDVKEFPDEDKGHYHTLAGMLMAVTGDLLTLHERVDIDAWQFEVVKLDGKRAAEVRAHKKLKAKS